MDVLWRFVSRIQCHQKDGRIVPSSEIFKSRTREVGVDGTHKQEKCISFYDPSPWQGNPRPLLRTLVDLDSGTRWSDYLVWAVPVSDLTEEDQEIVPHRSKPIHLEGHVNVCGTRPKSACRRWISKGHWVLGPEDVP